MKHWKFLAFSVQGTGIVYAPRRKTPKKSNAPKGGASSSPSGNSSGNAGASSAGPSGASGGGSTSGAGAGAPGGEPPGGGGGGKTPNEKVNKKSKEFPEDSPQIPSQFF